MDKLDVNAPFGPALGLDAAQGGSLAAMREDAKSCTRCDLYRHATQTVFGEGPEKADIVLVGEQPGDKEDLAGQPFVGPAGALLDDCLEEAGIDRRRCYVTNAVKHFKFEPRGKRRIHAKPNMGEIRACAFWLAGELTLLQPRLVIALGATALTSLLGSKVKLMANRGRILHPANHAPVLVTIHPSYLLRLPDREEAARQRADFVSDLSQAAT